MRYLGLDLGIKSLGIALSDENKKVVRALPLITFKSEDYNTAIDKLMEVIKDYNISKIALGLPKNMDNSLGFASKRSIKFKELLSKKVDIPIIFIDERLTTVEANNILISNNTKRGKKKKMIDGVSACLILETLIKMEENNESR